MAAIALSPLACSPVEDTDTRSVVPLSRSRTKTSAQLGGPGSTFGGQIFVSPGTRLEATEVKTTYLPSGVIFGHCPLAPLPCSPVEDTDTLVVVPDAAAAGEDQSARPVNGAKTAAAILQCLCIPMIPPGRRSGVVRT